MTRIIIVRHGQSEANLARRFASGMTDTPLTALGRQQAERIADYLIANEHIDKVYASPLSRATDTVRPTADRLGLPVIPEEGLREIRAGLWENQPHHVLRTDPRMKPDYDTWHTDLAHCRCTEGESIVELYERASEAVLRLAKENEGKTLLLGTHWTPTTTILTYAKYGDVLRIKETPSPFNASIHVICYENGLFTVEKQNVVEHLGDLLWAPTTSNETEE